MSGSVCLGNRNRWYVQFKSDHWCDSSGCGKWLDISGACRQNSACKFMGQLRRRPSVSTKLPRLSHVTHPPKQQNFRHCRRRRGGGSGSCATTEVAEIQFFTRSAPNSLFVDLSFTTFWVDDDLCVCFPLQSPIDCCVDGVDAAPPRVIKAMYLVRIPTKHSVGAATFPLGSARTIARLFAFGRGHSPQERLCFFGPQSSYFNHIGWSIVTHKIWGMSLGERFTWCRLPSEPV